jgi:polysaccharide biosynthesis transport protein
MAAGYLVASMMPPTYESQVELLVGPMNTDLETLRASGQLAGTYADVITSQPVLGATIAELGVTTPPAELLETVKATSNETTRLLTITVRDGDPQRAAAIANSLAGQLSRLAAQGTIRPEGQLTAMRPAVANPEPVAPQPELIMLLAAPSGLLAALFLVLLIDYFSQTVKSDEEVSELVGGEVLAVVDWISTRRRVGPGELEVEVGVDSPRVAAYRMLAAKLEFATGQRNLERLLLFGTDPTSGSGAIAANLAEILAGAGKRVALVDANGVNKQVTALLELGDHRGLSDLLADPALSHDEADLPLGDYVVWRDSGVLVLPFGQLPDPAAIDPTRVERFLEHLHRSVDVAIITTAPVQRSPSTLVWAHAADGALLSVQRDRSKRTDVRHAIDSLRFVGASLVGVVMEVGSPPSPTPRRRARPRPLRTPPSATTTREPVR